jgi:prevent-host-death family protein
MERMMSATEARVRFGELMRWVVDSQRPIIVERAGKPHVVVLSVSEYERLVAGRQEQDDWRKLTRQARDQIRADLGERELPAPEEIIRQMREERDAQLLALR